MRLLFDIKMWIVLSDFSCLAPILPTRLHHLQILMVVILYVQVMKMIFHGDNLGLYTFCIEVIKISLNISYISCFFLLRDFFICLSWSRDLIDTWLYIIMKKKNLLAVVVLWWGGWTWWVPYCVINYLVNNCMHV